MTKAWKQPALFPLLPPVPGGSHALPGFKGKGPGLCFLMGCGKAPKEHVGVGNLAVASLTGPKSQSPS